MIQDTTRFIAFEHRLNTSRLYHDRLSKTYNSKQLFAKYQSFVRSLPVKTYDSRTFNAFIQVMVDFEDECE